MKQPVKEDIAVMQPGYDEEPTANRLNKKSHKMQQWRGRCLRVKRRIRTGALALLLMFVLMSMPMGALADTVSDLQKQLDQKQQEKEQTQDALQDTQENLDALQAAQNGLKGKLGNLNDQLSEVGDNLADLEIKVEQKNLDILNTNELLEKAVQEEERQYASMKARIKFMYESGAQTYLEMLLSSKSISGLINQADYISQLEAYDRKLFEEYKATRIMVEEAKAKLEEEKADLDSLKAETEKERNRVQEIVTQTSTEVKQYAGVIGQTEEAALAYEAAIAEQEQEITRLKKQIEEEKAKSRLAANSTWRDISDVTFAEGDRTLLANLIYCEAGNQPYEGQLGVGAVVINRVRSSVYPNSVVGVIYQESQFSPVASGRLAIALAENRATPACYQAADAAMQGQTTVGNCVYFRTPIEGLTGLQIGGHIFY